MSDTIQAYVPASAEAAMDMSYDFQQVFHHDFSVTKTMAEYGIIKEYLAPEYEPERETGLAVLSFLKNFGFATRAQLAEALALHGIGDEMLDAVLDHYVGRRVMNYFIIAAFTMDIPDDAMKVYCLDHGATYLLSHFSNSDFVSWYTTDNNRSIRLVTKYLVTNRFYLALAKSRKDTLSYFRPLADFNTGKRQTRFSGDFRIMNGYTERNFILEVIRASDFPIDWMKKVDTQIEPFVCGERWKNYYRIEPVFIFMAEDEEIAAEAADIFYRRLGSEQFRVTTDDEIRKGMDKAKFWKYVPGEEGEKGALEVVNAAIFQPVKT